MSGFVLWSMGSNRPVGHGARLPRLGPPPPRFSGRCAVGGRPLCPVGGLQARVAGKNSKKSNLFSFSLLCSISVCFFFFRMFFFSSLSFVLSLPLSLFCFSFFFFSSASVLPPSLSSPPSSTSALGVLFIEPKAWFCTALMGSKRLVGHWCDCQGSVGGARWVVGHCVRSVGSRRESGRQNSN